MKNMIYYYIGWFFGFVMCNVFHDYYYNFLAPVFVTLYLEV